MTGDPTDMANRIRSVLPGRWFGDSTPVLDGLLQAIGVAWSLIYGLIQYTTQQARILTAFGSFLDLISSDFFGTELPRHTGESDNSFRFRITSQLLRPTGTRAAVIAGLEELTGRAPTIFEPALTSDTGGYSIGGVGYGVGGGWGNLDLAFQFFLTAYRPMGSGIAELAGYSSGGIPVYGSLAMEPAQILDADIVASVQPLLPAATIAWMRISD